VNAFTVTFGRIGDHYPIPALDTAARSRTDLTYKIQEHAHLYINPLMRGLGHPELTDPVLLPNPLLTAGRFIAPRLGEQSADRYCPVKIEHHQEQQ
jgi:hypothetical protein